MGSDGETVTTPPTTGGGPVVTPPTTSGAVGSATNSAGSYIVQEPGGDSYNLGAPGFSSNGQPAWSDAARRASAYESNSVLAIGGNITANGQTLFFAGITGSEVTAPTTGSATYTGRYGVNTTSGTMAGPLTLSANFDTATVVDLGSNLDVDATISGGAISGTATFQGTSADLEGGFYGSNEIAGAFVGNGIAGTIYGIED